MKYRKKPIEIYAVQFFKEKWASMAPPDFFEAVETPDGIPKIRTLEGCLFVSDGDYIIRGIKNEFYPCKPDIFEATYEPC